MEQDERHNGDETRTSAQLRAQLEALERDRDLLLAAQEQVSQLVEEWGITVNAIPDGVMLLDGEMRIRKVNEALCEMFGTTIDEAVGKTCYEVVHGTDHCFEKCPGREACELKVPITWEWHDPAGHRIFESTTTPILDLDGEMIGTVDVVRDVTAQKRAEQALRESEQWFRQLSDAASELFVIHDGRAVLDTNRAMLRAFGYRRDEIIGMAPDILIIEGWRFGQATREDLERSHPLECRARRKDGSDLPVEIWERDFQYHGRPVRLLAMRDLTLRREVEAERMRRGRLEASIETAGAACHEMNQPMQVLAGYVELLLEGIGDHPGLREPLLIINEQVDKLGGITRRLQNLGRYETREYIQGTRIIDLDRAGGRDEAAILWD